MLSIEKTIADNKLFKGGEVVGVAVSGGIDSMCLLHYLNANREKYDIEIVAVNVDHCVRPESENDTTFVVNYCKEHRIRHYKFKVDALQIAYSQKIGVEDACRKARYGVFDSLIKKGLLDKICIAHHQGDQVETVLLNIFRGTGLGGASGMSVVRGNYFRPMLNTSKDEIQKYAFENQIPNVEDETNELDDYNRNFIRNKVLPLLSTRWENIGSNILSFASIVREDHDFINRQINYDALIVENNVCKIPLTYFIYENSIINRIVKNAFEKIEINKDIEKTHIELVKQLARESENGSKISVPGATVHKEYDFITIAKNIEKEMFIPIEFEKGTFAVPDFGTIKVTKTKSVEFQEGVQKIDGDKLPENCFWRTKQTGDMFAKLGSGSKKLKDYFIDKKIPNRVRNTIPVLASGSEVFVVAGLDISEKVKLEEDSKNIYCIVCKK